MGDRTIYYRHADGSYSEHTLTGYEGDVEPPEGAVEVTAEEYRAAIDAMEAERQARIEAERAAAEAAAYEAYRALLDAKFTDAVARQMSGYTGPEGGPDSGDGSGSEPDD